MIEISSCMNSLVIWPPLHTKLYQQNHTKPDHISSLYLQLSVTVISIHNATLLSCHFWKIATVSHFRLVCATTRKIFGLMQLLIMQTLVRKSWLIRYKLNQAPSFQFRPHIDQILTFNLLYVNQLNLLLSGNNFKKVFSVYTREEVRGDTIRTTGWQWHGLTLTENHTICILK